MKKQKLFYIFFAIGILAAFLTACQPEVEEPKNYTVTFDIGIENNEVQSKVFQEDYTFTETDIAGIDLTDAKQGYTFEGWYSGETKLAAGYRVTQNVTFKAKWTAKTYIITFDSNGGSGTVNAVSAVYGDKIILPENTFTVPDGYKRTDGWEYNGTKYSAGDDISELVFASSGTIEFKALYLLSDYRITFSVLGTEYASYPINENETLSAENLAEIEKITKEHLPTGYKAISWYSKENAVNLSTLTVNENTVLDGKLVPISYTVKFDSNGYEGTAPEAIVCEYDAEYPVPENTLTKKYYKSSGWNTAASGFGTKYSAGDSFYNLTAEDGKEITLYAILEEDLNADVTINLVSEHGTVSDTMIVKYKSYISTDGYTGSLETQKLPVPSEQGYKFNGWKINDTLISDYRPVQVTDTITVTADWTANYISVYYYLNNSNKFKVYDSNTMNSVSSYFYETLRTGINTILNKDKILISDAYEFTGWNTKSDGSGTSYSDKADMKEILNSKTSSSIELYGQWVPKNMSVTVNLPSVSYSDLKLTYDETTMELSAQFGTSDMYTTKWYVDGTFVCSGSTFSVRNRIGGLKDGSHTVMATYTLDGTTYSNTVMANLNVKSE